MPGLRCRTLLRAKRLRGANVGGLRIAFNQSQTDALFICAREQRSEAFVPRCVCRVPRHIPGREVQFASLQ